MFITTWSLQHLINSIGAWCLFLNYLSSILYLKFEHFHVCSALQFNEFLS